jgi:hypothetical protein
MTKQPSRGRKPREDEKEASRSRLTPPPPSGLPVMPRPFEVADIRDDGGTVVTVEATAAERMSLAEAYNLPDIAALGARFNVVRRGITGKPEGGGVRRDRLASFSSSRGFLPRLGCLVIKRLLYQSRESRFSR